MITFKPVIRNVRSDGYAAVYIRVTKDRQSDYIKKIILFLKLRNFLCFIFSTSFLSLQICFCAFWQPYFLLR